MTKPISIIFLASAALHAAVLGLVRFDSPQTIQAGSPFRVSIQATSISSRENDAKQAMEQVRSGPSERATDTRMASIHASDDRVTPAHETRPTTLQQPDNTESHQETIAAVAKTTLRKQEETSSTTTTSLNTSHVDQTSDLSPKTASLLRVDLEQAFALNFHYPRLAIKHGWQGEVQLGLRIESNGHLSKLRILHSSGHRLLDNAAMKSLNKIQVLPNAVAVLNGQSMDLILPVKYQLL